MSKTPSVFAAIPIYGQTPWHFSECVIKLAVAPPCHVTINPLCGDSLVSRARNTLTALFLKSDCTHLLFIDSDLVFSGEQIKRLLNHDKDVIGGFYPKKQDGPLEWVCNAKMEETPEGANGVQEVRYMGTGFMLIKREVIEQMIVKHGAELAYHPDATPEETEWDFWSVGPYTAPDGFRRYLSEDWYFCQRWLDMGGKVYGDTRVILKHIGHAVYPLKSQEVSMLKTADANRVSIAA